MEEPVLKDKNQYPTEEVIFSYIGKNKPLWHSVFEYIHTNHPDFSEEWRYYNDGKSWLLKVTKKSKTIFWLSVIKNTFRTTFYFTDRAEELIKKSRISDKLKEEFKNGKRYNKIRGITITYTSKKNVEYIKELIAIKLNVK